MEIYFLRAPFWKHLSEVYFFRYPCWSLLFEGLFSRALFQGLIVGISLSKYLFRGYIFESPFLKALFRRFLFRNPFSKADSRSIPIRRHLFSSGILVQVSLSKYPFEGPVSKTIYDLDIVIPKTKSLLHSSPTPIDPNLYQQTAIPNPNLTQTSATQPRPQNLKPAEISSSKFRVTSYRESAKVKSCTGRKGRSSSVLIT